MAVVVLYVRDTHSGMMPPRADRTLLVSPKLRNLRAPEQSSMLSTITSSVVVTLIFWATMATCLVASLQ